MRILGPEIFRTIQNQHYSRLLLCNKRDRPLFKPPFFWVFATNHSSKLEYLPIPNNHNFVIDLPISQNGFSVCFVIQSLEKNQIQMVHELKYALSVFVL